jgi:hypothetical protein
MMSRRLKITLPDPICEQLSDMAASSGEPVARLAAQIVRNKVCAIPENDPAPLPRRCIASSRRPRWLEPQSDDGSWRASMWEEIEALYRRYPKVLGDLVERWWENESCVETLCALATWRRSIDEMGHDPQEELNFQGCLAKCSEVLQRDATPGARAWTPGRRPDEWDDCAPPTTMTVEPRERRPFFCTEPG